MTPSTHRTRPAANRPARYRLKALESAATRTLLAGIFVTGLLAQFVDPLGEALEGKAFLGGALLTLLAYVLYESVAELNSKLDRKTPGSTLTHLELAAFFDEAFSQRNVHVRFMGYTGETIFEQLRQKFEDVRDNPGRIRSIRIQIMVPDFTSPSGIPRRVADDGTLTDDPDFRQYLQQKVIEHHRRLNGLALTLRETTGIQATVEVRQFLGSPSLKLCLLGDEHAFFGVYDQIARTGFPYDDPDRTILDPQGYRTDYFHWDRRIGEEAAKHVETYQRFLDEHWQTASPLRV